MMSPDQAEHIERLSRIRPQYRQALEAYGRLKEAAEGALSDRDPFKEIALSITGAGKTAFPLFDRCSPPFDLSFAKEALRSVLKSQTEANKDDGFKRAIEVMEAQPAWADRLLGAYQRGETAEIEATALVCGLAGQALAFMAGLALSTPWKALKEALGELESKEWLKPYCPVCGSSPSLSFLSRSGKRHLYCKLCSMSWEFLRAKCPFCLNTDPDSIGYLEFEGVEGYRIDLCNACKRYMKNFDTRSLECPAPLEMEDIATLHLDIAAMDQGFKGALN